MLTGSVHACRCAFVPLPLLRPVRVPRASAKISRKTATVPTRSPVKATGLKMCVAYFTTTKLIPQIVAIAKSSASVKPKPVCARESATIGADPTDSVIDEN